MLRNIAIFADKLRRENHHETKKGRRHDSVNSGTTPATSSAGTVATVDTTRGVVQETVAPTANIPRLPAPPPSLAIMSGSSGSLYQESQRNDSSRPKDYRSSGKGAEYQRDYPDLPMDIRFVINAGWTDILRLAHDFIDNWHLCRTCLINKNASTSKVPHNTSKFPALPNDPEERYSALAYRLVTVRLVEKMILSREHPAIDEKIGPVREGLRQNVQPAAGVPPPTLRKPPTPPGP